MMCSAVQCIAGLDLRCVTTDFMSRLKVVQDQMQL